MGRSSDTTSLAPGFRFHPTDEELVRYYLKRKVTNKPLRFDAISVIDIYKTEPWDLPSKSKLKSRDLEWYFFSVLDKKYGNGSKTNRATEKGYWKTTGKDRPIKVNSRTVGMKKTLVFHQGRAPRGARSNWVMHEYRLADEQLEKDGVVQDAFVLCRIFQKSGTGPKNGEQYGAPFVEEEWDDDEEVAWLPSGVIDGEMVVADEVAAGDDGYVENNEFDQNFDITVPGEESPVPPVPFELSPEESPVPPVPFDFSLEESPAPLNFYQGETSNYVEHSQNCSADDQKPMIGDGERRYSANLQDEQYFLDSPGEYEMDATKSVKEEYVADPSDSHDAIDVNYLLDEPYLDAVDNPEFREGLFLEANDLSNPEQPTSGDPTGFDMLEEYLNYFDANDQNLSFDPSELFTVNDDAVSDQDKESQTLSESSSDAEASSSKQKPETMPYESGIKYPFLKQASNMLGSITAPPAFASEFPSKDAALRLHAAQSSSSIHVTAGMIRIENMSLGANAIDWSFGKNGNVNIILSFGLSQGEVSPSGSVPVASYFSGKSGSMVSRGWYILMFFWVLILSVSYKIGTCVCAK